MSEVSFPTYDGIAHFGLPKSKESELDGFQTHIFISYKHRSASNVVCLYFNADILLPDEKLSQLRSTRNSLWPPSSFSSFLNLMEPRLISEKHIRPISLTNPSYITMSTESQSWKLNIKVIISCQSLSPNKQLPRKRPQYMHAHSITGGIIIYQYRNYIAGKIVGEFYETCLNYPKGASLSVSYFCQDKNVLSSQDVHDMISLMHCRPTPTPTRSQRHH